MRHATMAVLVVALAGCAKSPQLAIVPVVAGPAHSVKTANGPVLANARGMTLYTYDIDAPGRSNCNGKCAVNWPPLMAAPMSHLAGPWTIVTRDDGSQMWAYAGKPLYTSIMDKKPGDTAGDGVGGVWHVARP